MLRVNSSAILLLSQINSRLKTFQVKRKDEETKRNMLNVS